MIRVCYICHTVMGEKEPFEDRSETHGLCDACFQNQMEEIEKDRGSRNEERGNAMNDQPLTEIESAIMAILNEHKGRGQAIQGYELVAQLNHSRANSPIGERDVRKTIKHLVERHGYRIGSGHNGYFIIETEKELMEISSYYRSYGLSILHVESKLRRLALPDLLGQIRLELEGK